MRPLLEGVAPFVDDRLRRTLSNGFVAVHFRWLDCHQGVDAGCRRAARSRRAPWTASGSKNNDVILREVAGSTRAIDVLVGVDSATSRGMTAFPADVGSPQDAGFQAMTLTIRMSPMGRPRRCWATAIAMSQTAPRSGGRACIPMTLNRCCRPFRRIWRSALQPTKWRSGCALQTADIASFCRAVGWSHGTRRVASGRTLRIVGTLTDLTVAWPNAHNGSSIAPMPALEPGFRPWARPATTCARL